MSVQILSIGNAQGDEEQIFQNFIVILPLQIFLALSILKLCNHMQNCPPSCITKSFLNVGIQIILLFVCLILF